MNERRHDFELLQRFARHGEQSAFAEVVRRHLDLVFATALRKLEDPGAAQEVAQNVFTVLARKAWQFAPDDSLPAWLHKTTLLESKSWLRGELRRRRREQTAAELGTTMSTPEDQPAFHALVPLLDEALLSLRETDRTALLLRYCESQSLRDVGATLGVSEDTAQKRVTTALEKLSQFFQRRGYRTATAAMSAAALQHTAASASAATLLLITNAALQTAPPGLAGLGALLARSVSLSKAQVTMLWVALVAVPVSWQWNEHRAAGDEVKRIQTQFATASADYDALQTEIERLRKVSSQLDASVAEAAKSVAQSAEAGQKFETWKKHLREQLMAVDYRWPDDSPFVRIPKSALRKIDVHRPISPPGIIKQETRELLGLTPQEREEAESILRDHFTRMDVAIEAKVYETNQPSGFNIPATALASKIIVVPPLGNEVKNHSDELLAGLRHILGEERWPLVEEQLASSSPDTLRRILNLDDGQK